MGQVSASSTVLIDAEPNRGGRSRGLRLVRPKILPALQQLPGARGRAGAGTSGDMEAAGHQIADARRQGEPLGRSALVIAARSSRMGRARCRHHPTSQCARRARSVRRGCASASGLNTLRPHSAAMAGSIGSVQSCMPTSATRSAVVVAGRIPGAPGRKNVANQCCYLPVFMLTMYQ